MEWGLSFPRRTTAVLACAAAVAAGAVANGPPAWARPAPGPAATIQNWLYGISAVSATDLWAVGTKDSGHDPLIENSSGGRWKAVTSPKPTGAAAVSLYGVSAASAGDVWAVGSATVSGTNKTVIEQWNGTAWTIVASPDPSGATGSYLYGVDAVSASDVWAVGYARVSGTDESLIEQWNGTAWTIVPSPNPAGSGLTELSSVYAVSPTDAWAVGYYFNADREQVPVSEQWNGTSWTVVSTPAPSTQSYLASVSGSSASDVWAVGYYANSAGDWVSAVEQWNGTSWAIVSNPDPSGAVQTYLEGVDAVSASDIWAVGWSVNSAGTWSTLIEHSNGKTWTIVTSPNPAGDDLAALDGIASASSSDIWTAGYAGASVGGTQDTLTEHSSGHKWAIVASANP
jgi:hypothetical protein